MSREIIFVICGPRDIKTLEQAVKIIRRHDPIISLKLYHADYYGKKAIEHFAKEPYNMKLVQYQMQRHDAREQYRNSSLVRLEGLMDSEADNVCYMDNDLFIIDWNAFVEGFTIAEKWGFAAPMNPRCFVKVEEEIGADVSDRDKQVLKDCPKHVTAINLGLIFFNKKTARTKLPGLMMNLIYKQKEYPSRGQMGLYVTMWEHGVFPLVLPFQWLVCKKHVGIEDPICLHVGHEEVRQWWEKEFKGK